MIAKTLSGRLAAAASRAGATRALSSTPSLRQVRAPSMGDINPSAASIQEFNNNQKAFREQLVEAQKERGARALAAMNSTSANPSAASAAASSSPSSSSSPPSSSSLLSSSSTTSSSSSSSATPTGQHGSSDIAGATAEAHSHEPERKQGTLSNLIYGTKEGREMEAQMEASFSQVLARGKYVHSIVFHDVKPDKVDEYVELTGKFYPKMANTPENKVHLVGSWRTEVGDCDTFVHIWEYQRYQGYHESRHSISHHPDFRDFNRKLSGLIHSKSISLMQEFSFWPTTPPRHLGGVFELRSYTLHPGNLLEWETHWRRGLKARREVMEGVGAWFVQIGDINTVHHLWQFANLEERRARREKSWQIEGWSDTVHKTVPLIQTMKSRILVPMPWSPVA